MLWILFFILHSICFWPIKTFFYAYFYSSHFFQKHFGNPITDKKPQININALYCKNCTNGSRSRKKRNITACTWQNTSRILFPQSRAVIQLLSFLLIYFSIIDFSNKIIFYFFDLLSLNCSGLCNQRMISLLSHTCGSLNLLSQNITENHFVNLFEVLQ